MEVKNKIAYQSINRVEKLIHCNKKVINIQRFKVSGLCDILNSSYSAMELFVWRHVAGNQHKHLEFTLALSKHFNSLLDLKTFA